MPRIPEEIIDEIRSKSDIIDVISNYVPLKKMGNRYKGLCPFHTEKTPSFIVSTDNQAYHCFGCGKGGNVFNFIMQKEGVDFIGAVHILASRCGVYIPEGKGVDQARSDDEKKHKDTHYQIHKVMSAWYVSNLARQEGIKGAEYLKGRNLTKDVIDKFQIGYAPDSWDAGLKYARSLGFSDKDMIESGLALKNETSGRVYDRFRNRVVFSICNEQGNVVAFSARAIEATDQGGKYINSPETPIFKKSRILYALQFARNGMKEKGFAILCEGQIDTISFFRAGFDNAVAPQGTAFTEEQAMILRRYTDCVNICFDGDSAGQNAIVKAIDLLLPLEFSVRVISLPDGKDPDDIYRNSGAEALDSCVRSSIDFFDFLLGHVSRNVDMKSPYGKDKVVKMMLEKIMKIKSDVVKSSYISMLSSKLLLPEQAVFSEMRKMTSRSSGTVAPAPDRMSSFQATHAMSTDLTGSISAEELLLHLTMTDGNVGRRLDTELDQSMISDTVIGKALNTAISMTINGEWEFIRDALSNMLNETPDHGLSRILTMDMVNPENYNIEKAVSDCIRRIRDRSFKDRIAFLMAGLKENRLSDDEKKELADLQKRQRERR